MLESNVALLKSAVQLNSDIVRREFEEIHIVRIWDKYVNWSVMNAESLLAKGELKSNMDLRCFFVGRFGAYYDLMNIYEIGEIIRGRQGKGN